MPNISVHPSADLAAKTIELNISDLPAVIISYESEADFTGLINALLLIMDRDIQIDLSISEVEGTTDARLSLVMETIREIIESYNSTFESSPEVIDEPEDGGSFEYNEDDDLPF
jgi:ethanolamine utilization protein EutA (predicted chaperonin)